MYQHSIFSATLGLSSPWQITGISFSKEERRMDVSVNFQVDDNLTCSNCGTLVKVASVSHELWHHQDFFSFATYLHAQVPMVDCPCCGGNAVERPWTIGASQFRQLD